MIRRVTVPGHKNQTFEVWLDETRYGTEAIAVAETRVVWTSTRKRVAVPMEVKSAIERAKLVAQEMSTKSMRPKK